MIAACWTVPLESILRDGASALPALAYAVLLSPLTALLAVPVAWPMLLAGIAISIAAVSLGAARSRWAWVALGALIGPVLTAAVHGPGEWDNPRLLNLALFLGPASIAAGAAYALLLWHLLPVVPPAGTRN